MSCKITELEQLRHVLTNKAMCMTSDIKVIMDALTEGLPDNYRDITTKQLMKHEGFKARPYKCSMGKWTIGFGINLETESIPYEVALHWLEYKVEECDKLLSDKLSFFSKLTDNRKSVLINMCFNLGLKGLLRFKRMIAALETEDYKAAAKEMIQSRWASQVGNRAIELKELMENG